MAASTHAAAPLGPTATAAPAAAAIAVAPLLDAAKGGAAVADFDRLVARYCATGTDVARSEKAGPKEKRGPEAVELDRVSWKKACPPFKPIARALASGAFTAAGADEVVMVAGNGNDRAEGDVSLLLMAKDDHYRVRRILRTGQGFSASARVTVAGGPDVLLLCDGGGAQGEYYGTCGFLGNGSFRAPIFKTPVAKDKSSARDEIALRSVIQCGPGWRVDLGEVATRGDRLIVQLVTEEAVYVARGGDSDACEKATKRRRKAYGVEYRLEEGSFRRVGPLPRPVQQMLNR